MRAVLAWSTPPHTLTPPPNPPPPPSPPSLLTFPRLPASPRPLPWLCPPSLTALSQSGPPVAGPGCFLGQVPSADKRHLKARREKKDGTLKSPEHPYQPCAPTPHPQPPRAALPTPQTPTSHLPPTNLLRPPSPCLPALRVFILAQSVLTFPSDQGCLFSSLMAVKASDWTELLIHFAELFMWTSETVRGLIFSFFFLIFFFFWLTILHPPDVLGRLPVC